MIRTALFSLWTGADAFEKSLSRQWFDYATCSVQLAHRQFPHVVLITDDRGRDILANRLALPFTEVRTTLNAIPPQLSFLYAIGKIYGYRELASEARPFIGFDLDWFTWNRPPERILNAPAVSQHQYPINLPLRMFCDELMKRYPEIPMTGKSCCSGALGGNDTTRLLAFAEQSLQMASDPSNERLLRSGTTPWIAPCAIEEALFCSFFPQHEGFLPFGERPTDQDWINAGVGHLVGKLKNDPMQAERIRRIVMLAWPDHYERATAAHAAIVRNQNPS